MRLILRRWSVAKATKCHPLYRSSRLFYQSKTPGGNIRPQYVIFVEPALRRNLVPISG
jgi:hypothetical protein